MRLLVSGGYYGEVIWEEKGLGMKKKVVIVGCVKYKMLEKADLRLFVVKIVKEDMWW